MAEVEGEVPLFQIEIEVFLHNISTRVANQSDFNITGCVGKIPELVIFSGPGGVNTNCPGIRVDRIRMVVHNKIIGQYGAKIQVKRLYDVVTCIHQPYFAPAASQVIPEFEPIAAGIVHRETISAWPKLQGAAENRFNIEAVQYPVTSNFSIVV